MQPGDVEELMVMKSLNHLDKSAVEAGKRVAFIVVAALGLTLRLQSQQSAIGDSAEASARQPARAANNQAQQLGQYPTTVKKRIEQPAEELTMDPSTIALDDGGPPAVPSSSAENADPHQTAPLRVRRVQSPIGATP
jgi:hypothetical protein